MPITDHDQTLAHKARVLMVATMPCHPASSGNKARLLSMIRQFRQAGFAVDLIWFSIENGGAISDAAYAAMQDDCDRLFVTVPEDPTLGSRSALPELDALFDAGLDRLVRWCLANFDYDALWLNYVFLSYLADCTSTVPVIIDTHDVLGDRDIRLRAEGRPVDSYTLSRAAETAGLTRADMIIAITENDAETLTDRTSTPVITLGHRALAESTTKQLERPHQTPLTIGAFASNYDPSRAGLSTVINQVKKHGTENAVTLHVAGSVCDMIQDEDFVIKHGFVDDLMAFCARLDLIIVPVDYGSGLKIKAVEALATGRPVLATRHSTIGLNPQSSAHQIEDCDELAKEIASLAKDPSGLQGIRKASQSLWHRYKADQQAQFDTLIEKIRALKDANRGKAIPTLTLADLQTFAGFSVMGAGTGLQRILGSMPAAPLLCVMDNLKAGAPGPTGPIKTPESAAQTFADHPVINTVSGPVGHSISQQLQDLGFTQVYRLL